MPSTLKAFAEQQRDHFQEKKTSTQQAFGDAQRAFTEAKETYGDLSKTLSDLEKQIANTRKAMAAGPMPADSQALLVKWRDLIIQHRAKRSELLEVEKNLDKAEKDLNRTQSELSRISEQLTEAQKTLEEEEKRDKRKSELKEKLTQEPLSNLRARVEAVLAGVEVEEEPEEPGEPEEPEEPSEPPVPEELEAPEEPDQETVADRVALLEAKDRVEGDIPESLYQRAIERGRSESDRLVIAQNIAVDAETQLLVHKGKTEGPSGKVAKLQRMYLQGEAAFSDYVKRSKERYDQVLTLIKGINSSAELTDAETNRINDAGLVARAEAALTQEKARDEARDLVESKEAQLAQKKLELLAEDIDTDIDGNADVQTLEAALANLRNDLVAAEAAFTDAERRDLDTWEASVPDPIWANLASFERAKNILADLKDTNPDDLATAMDDAEKALANALKKASKSARGLEYLRGEAKQKRERMENVEGALNQRFLSAIRGDN